MIIKRCPGCETRFEFAEELDGKRVKCKSCGVIFRVDHPGRSARDDVDEGRRRPVRRRDEDDEDRPAAVSRRHTEEDEEEDDRPRPRARVRDDDDDDEQPSRTRRPVLEDDDDDRPRRRPREDEDDEEEDDRSARRLRDDSDDRLPRRRDDDDDDDAPRKKRRIHPLLIIGPAVALLIVIGVVLVLALRKKAKDGPGGELGDLVKAPTKSCPLEVAEKDCGTLVLPDGGNLFGLLRRKGTLEKSWTFDAYDLAAGRRVGRLEIKDMDDPRAASLSPDGKHLLIHEIDGFGGFADHALSIWNIPDNKSLVRKWVPYQKAKNNPIDSPTLYRTEFLNSDKVMTLSTARVFDVWPLANLQEPVVAGARYAATGDQLGKDDRFGMNTHDKYQRQVAFSPDHKTMAVWNGNGYTLVNCLEGLQTIRTAPLSELRILQPTAGGAAFSPDGSVLAGIIHSGRFDKDVILCLWDTKEQKPPIATYDIPANQFNESPGIAWWGNRYVVTSGGRVVGADVEGMLIDVRTGLAKRQLMGPDFRHYGLARDGRLWYAASPDRNDAATMHAVDPPDPELLNEPDDYEQIMILKEEFFLRRLWLEPQGVMRKPTRINPPLQQRLIRRP
jgi:hypothetical protein